MPPTEKRVTVSGRMVTTGLPATVELTAGEVYAALRDSLAHLDALLLSILERTPPELMSDISHTGMVLTGGGAQLSGLAEHLSRLTSLPVTVAEEPANAVAIGTTRALESRSQLRLVSAKQT